MAFSSLITVLTLAIVSRNVTSTKTTEIQFIRDFIECDASKSLTLIGFMCWNTVEKFNLASRLSQDRIIFSIYDMEEKNIEFYHLNGNSLYLVDLDCGKSMDIISSANDMKLFAAPNKWLLLTANKDYIENSNYHFSIYNFSVDSKIILTFKTYPSQYDLYEIYKYNVKSVEVKQNYVTQWTDTLGFKNYKTYVSAESRRDLNGTRLRAVIVALDNDTFNHLLDYRFRHIDLITKVNYIFTTHLYDYTNSTRYITSESSWGYLNKETNTYNGMIGYLQRDEAEIGGTSLFVTYDRVSVIEYIGMTSPTRAKFIFRAPPLSYVSNIFTLPFSGNVWLSSLGLCMLVSVMLYVAVSVEWVQSREVLDEKALSPSLLDTVMLTIGAVAQQGSTREPKASAGRTVMVLTFITLMFLYVSYSANIVALLQSSAKNIRTLEDLLHSRLKLGVDDVIYNRYYFKHYTEPIRKAIYEKKVAPKGKKPNFMSLEEGVAQVRKGFFAFHGERAQVYKLIADTFYENEKCGLQEIEYLYFVDPYYSIKKNSSYKEIFKIGLRKIQESGIQSREMQRLYTKKPECLSSGGNFISVGLIESYPALVLGVGMGLSIVLLIIEKIIHIIDNKKRQNI